jgi:hypothetical protein
MIDVYSLRNSSGSLAMFAEPTERTMRRLALTVAASETGRRV